MEETSEKEIEENKPSDAKQYRNRQGAKVLRHPKVDDIIRMLTEGKSPKVVADWLKEVYPKSKKLQVNYMTLQFFRKNHLQISGEALKELKEATRGQSETEEAKRIKDEVFARGAVVKKKHEYLSQVIDVNGQFEKINNLCWDRLKKYQDLESICPKSDAVMVQYIRELRGLTELFLKTTQMLKDSGTNVNINIGEVQEEIGAIKNAVQRALLKTDPKLVQPFVEEFKKEMEELGHLEPDKFFAEYAKVQKQAATIKAKGDKLDININLNQEKQQPTLQGEIVDAEFTE